MDQRSFAVFVVAGALLAAAGCKKSQDEQAPSGPRPQTPATAPIDSSGADSQPDDQAARNLPLPQPETTAISPRLLAMAQTNINAGIAYLLSQQNVDGGWGPGQSHPAFTGLVLKSLVQHPGFTADSPAVARGYAYMLKYQQPDGAIYNPSLQGGQPTYTTSLAVMALTAAGKEEYRPVIAKAANYLKGLQVVGGSRTPGDESVDEDHPSFGGIDYGRSGEPNLSTLHFALEALDDAGVPKNDPVWANAVIFLSRTQNFSENDQPWAEVVNDGGFVYGPSESKAGKVTGSAGREGLRSYGSMTYAGFKSLLYADVSRDDPRVQAAFEWIRQYWRLDSNPNMPQSQSYEGLYYYYHTFAKALRAWGQDVITDTQGIRHNWREELIEVLDARRREDGSWLNERDRWFEDQPVLVTAYAVLALEEALQK